MYKLKTLITITELQPNVTMYKLKNYHKEPTVPENLVDGQSTSEEKIKIINQYISAIKEQISMIRSIINSFTVPEGKAVSDVPTEQSCLKNLVNAETFCQAGITHEIVLNANIRNPPYSLLGIRKLYNNLQLNVSIHIHSSVNSLPTNLEIFNKLSDKPKDQNALNIRLVWKYFGNVNIDCELVLSPLNYNKIIGEVNLLRFIHRNATVSTDIVNESNLDHLLDLCYQLKLEEKFNQKLFDQLSSNLKNKRWLSGDSMSVADLSLWSVLQSLSGISFKNNVSMWLKSCNVLFHSS